MMSMRASRLVGGPIVGLTLVVLLATAASAQPADYDRTVIVEADEAITLGEQDTIHGSLVVMGGRAHVLGRVEGDLIVVDGAVTLGPTARVDGSALTVRGAIERHELARVAGEEKKLSAAEFARVMAGLTDALADEEVEPEAATDEGEEAEAAEAEEIEAAEREEDEAAEGAIEPDEHVAPEDAGPAEEPAVQEVRRDLGGFGNTLVVPAGEIRIADVSSFGGAIIVDGVVRGDVACFGGHILVRGEVDGDIASFGGTVELEADSRVTGDIATFGASVEKHPEAVHEGQVVGLGGGLGKWVSGDAGRERPPGAAAAEWFLGTIAGILLAVLVAGIFPNATRTVADAIMAKPGSAAAHGGLTVLLFLPVCFVLAITCVGLILLPVVILALIGAFILGTVGVELIVGGRLVRSTGWAVTSLIGLAVLGAVVLRTIAALELLPGLGIVSGLVVLAVVIFGVGGALMTGFGTRPDGEWILRRLRRRRLSVEVTADSVDEPAEHRSEPTREIGPPEESATESDGSPDPPTD